MMINSYESTLDAQDCAIYFNTRSKVASPKDIFLDVIIKRDRTRFVK